MSTRYLALMIFTAVLSGCSTSQPHLYQGIASSAQMSVNSRESSQKTPFAFTGDMRIEGFQSNPFAHFVEGSGSDFSRLSASRVSKSTNLIERERELRTL